MAARDRANLRRYEALGFRHVDESCSPTPLLIVAHNDRGVARGSLRRDSDACWDVVLDRQVVTLQGETDTLLSELVGRGMMASFAASQRPVEAGWAALGSRVPSSGKHWRTLWPA